MGSIDPTFADFNTAKSFFDPNLGTNDDFISTKSKEPFSKPAPKEQVINEALSTEISYNQAVREALEADHQFYDEKKLKPYALGDTPSLPGITNLLFSPLLIYQNTAAIIKSKIVGNHSEKALASLKVFTESVNFGNALLTALKYAITFKLITLTFTALTPVIIFTGLVISCLEIAVHSYRLYKDIKFSKGINTTMMPEMIKLVKATKEKRLNRPKIQRLAKNVRAKLFKNQKYLENYYGEDFTSKMLMKLLQLDTLCKEETKYSENDIRDFTKDIFAEFNKNFCLKNLELISQNHLQLTDNRKEKLEKIAQANFKKLPHIEALHKTLGAIQHEHKKKKIRLGARVEPWLAAEFANRYNFIVQKLKSNDMQEFDKGVDMGTKLILHLKQNSQTNQKLNVLGLSSFSLVIVSYLISIFLPMASVLPIIFLGIATLYGLISYVIKKGIAESRSGKFEPIRCIPNWAVKLAKKASSSFEKPKKENIYANDLTEILSNLKLA